MDRTSWKPKIYKATETVDYKSNEEGTSDGAKKGWLTRQRGGSAEEPKKDFTPIDWAGQVGATKSEADQDKASDLMDKYYELVNEPMEDLPSDGSAMEERRSIYAKGVADFKAYLESSGSATVNQDVTDILEDENYHTLNKMLTKEEPETQSSRDKEFYDQSTQNTLDTLNQSKVNGFPFFSYVGQPKQVISDGKGGIILYGMKRNPNSIRRVDVKYDEGRDTYSVSFMSNRNKPKGEYNDVYFDQLSGLIAGNKGLGVESKANEDKYQPSEYDLFDDMGGQDNDPYLICKICKQRVNPEGTDWFATRVNHLNIHGIQNLNDVSDWLHANESKASEYLDLDYPISGFDWNYNDGEPIFTCKHCNKELVDDSMEGMKNHLKEHGITGHIEESKASEDYTDFFSWEEIRVDGSSGLNKICNKCGKVFYIENEEGMKSHIIEHSITESKASELKTYNNYNGKLNQEAQDVLRQWVSTLNHSSEVDFYNIPQDVLDTVNKYTSDWMEVETFIDTISYYEEDVRGFESKASEDDHKKSWDKLDSIAKQGFSDIGYDQKSWDSEPEEVRAEMETVVKDNLGENWKEVANKIYREELNKGKKSGGESRIDELHGELVEGEFWDSGWQWKCDHCSGFKLGSEFGSDQIRLIEDHLKSSHGITEAKLKAGYVQCPHCSTQMSRLDWLQDHIKTSHPTKASESVLEKVNLNGWEFSVIDNGYGGGSFGSTPNHGLLEVGIFAPKSGSKTMAGDSEIKGWLTPEEVEDLKRTFEVDPVMAYRRIGGDWEEDWQKGLESKANEDDVPEDYWEYRDQGDPPDDWVNWYECKTCGKNRMDDGSDSMNTVDQHRRDNPTHRVEWTNATEESYSSEGRKAELNKEINKLVKFIEIASVENPMHMSEYMQELEELKTERESLGESAYGHGSATGRMSPRDSWEQGYLADGTLGGGRMDPMFHDFRTMHWSELPSDIQEAWKAQGDYYSTGEGLVDNIEKQLNRFGVNLDRDPDQVEESTASEGFDQGLYGHVDAKCKTCGVEFDSIPDMNDHYAMHSDHVSNLDDLDNNIPNSD